MLQELAKKWGTDKAFFYAPYYEVLFSGRTVYKLLEIGIGTKEVMAESIARAGWTDYRPGASLRMWAEYFPDADIYGIDKDRNACVEASDTNNRITTFWADTLEDNNLAFLLNLRVIGPFDIIIDDGSHAPQDQVLTMLNFYPLLAPDGIYITEDVSEPFETPYPAELVSFSNEYGKASIYVVRR